MEDDFDGLQDNQAKYLMIELESLVNYQQFDIDKMVEHTTIEDFMSALKTRNGQSSLASTF